MKIKELYVAGFGKLKDLKMTFDDGLNVIVRDNGFGKTTLCAFIKAMFYGMPVTRSKTADDPRKKYEPWSGKHYGGSLVYENEGKSVRIERVFGKTLAGDKCVITDEKTGERLDIGPDTGETLFGIDRDAFTKCIMIPENFVLPSASASISEKMASLSTESENVRVEDAVKKLDEWRFVLSRTGRRGYIEELRTKRNDLQTGLSSAEENLRRLESLSEETQALLGDKELCEKQLIQAEEYAKVYECGLRCEELKTRIEALSENKDADSAEKVAFLSDEIKRFERQRDFHKASVDDEERRKSLQPLLKEKETKENQEREACEALESAVFCFKKPPDGELLKDVDAGTNGIFRRTATCEKLREESDEIKKQRDSVEKPLLNGKKTAVGVVLAILGAIALAVGAVLMFSRGAGAVPYAACGGGAVLLVVGLIVLSGALKSYSAAKKVYDTAVGEFDMRVSLTENALSDEKKAINDVKENLSARLRDIGVEEGYSAEISSRLAADRVRYGSLKNQADFARIDLENFLSKNENDLKDAAKFDSDALTRLTNGYNELVKKVETLKEEKVRAEASLSARKDVLNKNKAELLAELEEKRGAFEAFSMDYPEEWEKIPPEEVAKAVNGRLRETEKLLADKRTRADLIRKQTPDISAIRTEISLCDEKIAIYTRKLANTYKAIDYLKLAENALSDNYLPKLRENLAKLLGKIGLFETEKSGGPSKIALDKDFGLTVEEAGSMRQVSAFSRGTAAIIGFLMRLSLMESLYGGEIPLLILDDCFNDLDAKNYFSVKTMLKNLTPSVQILYFSCFRD